MKIVITVLTLATGVVGLYASWLWLKASRIDPPLPEVQSGDTECLHADQINALLIASWQSGALNARAARWTAVAVFLGTISSLLGLLSF